MFCVLLLVPLSIYALQGNGKNITEGTNKLFIPSENKAIHDFFPKRARGFSTEFEYLKPSVIVSLAKWNVNILRINVGTSWKQQKDDYGLKEPLKIYSQAIKNIDSLLPACHLYGVKLIIALNNVPGKKEKSFWTEEGMIKHVEYLAMVWKAIAQYYVHEPSIVAYDILNEPRLELRDANVWYDRVLSRLIKAIRSVDPSITMIIEPGPWGRPDGFEKMRPFEDPNVIYSFHMYAPHTFTHQGIKNNKNTKGKLRYPGWLQMYNTSFPKYWDKERLKEYMDVAYRFQQRYKVRMLVGEFGVARWAPGRERWVQDNIDVFELYGWDWCYYSYGEMNRWNPTFGPYDEVSSIQDGNKTTETLKILLQNFKKNQ